MTVSCKTIAVRVIEHVHQSPPLPPVADDLIINNRPFAWSGHMVQNIMLGRKYCSGTFRKKRKVGLDWYEFLYFGSPTALFASQLNLFCTMWPDHAKDLLLLRPDYLSGDQASLCDSENYAGKTIGHTDLAKPDWLKGPFKYNLAQTSRQIYTR